MQEIDAIGTHRFAAKLRGVDVECLITYEAGGQPVVNVEVRGSLANAIGAPEG